MFLADVVGTVVSPVQIPLLEGRTLLLLRPVTPDGRPAGRTRIGIDRAQAGAGDRVLVLDEGNSGRQILDAPEGAVKTIVVGVVDYVEHGGELAYDHRRPAPLEQLPGRHGRGEPAPAGAPRRGAKGGARKGARPR